MGTLRPTSDSTPLAQTLFGLVVEPATRSSYLGYERSDARSSRSPSTVGLTSTTVPRRPAVRAGFRRYSPTPCATTTHGRQHCRTPCKEWRTMMGVHRVHGDRDRHVRLVLRSLGWCALRTRRAGGWSACALRRGVRHRGAERQLLPVAPRHDVRGVAGPVARGLSDVGEGGAGLTHARRLRSPEQWIERFTRCWHELGHRRGALLVQAAPCRTATMPGWTTSSVPSRRR